MTDRIATDRKEASAAQTQLDGLVVNIELTLISIIQGVAFSFLADSSREVLVNLQFAFWSYAVTGLLIILIFWSRSLIHTLTVIRWPLDLGHNFMYIACTLIEIVTFTQLTNPLHWYALNALLALTSLALFVLDLRMIRRRTQDSAGPVSNRLYAMVEQEQSSNIRFFMPTVLAFNLFATLAVQLAPVSLIQQRGHMVIGLVQLAATFAYLLYVMHFFTRIVPLIVSTRQEWRDDVLP